MNKSINIKIATNEELLQAKVERLQIIINAQTAQMDINNIDAELKERSEKKVEPEVVS